MSVKKQIKPRKRPRPASPAGRKTLDSPRVYDWAVKFDWDAVDRDYRARGVGQ